MSSYYAASVLCVKLFVSCGNLLCSECLQTQQYRMILRGQCEDVCGLREVCYAVNV